MATAHARGWFSGVSTQPSRFGAVHGLFRPALLLIAFILALLMTRSARAEGFGPNTDWGSRLCTGAKQCRLGYFNNDGYVDVLVYDPTSGTTLEVAAGSTSGFGGPNIWYSSSTAFSWIRVGDFDGDGLTDVVASPGTGVGVLASTGSSFANYSQWYSGTLSFYQLEVGDVDFDGDEDLVTFSHWPEYDVSVALSTSAAFSAPVLWHGGFGGDVVRVGDIDGDGAADVVGFWWSNEVYAALSNGQNAFGPQVSLWHNWFGGDEPNLADVNLDGKKDAVAFNKWSGDVWVTYSNGSAFGPSVSQMHNDFCNNLASCMPGDVNGDGWSDLVGFSYTDAGEYRSEYAYVSLRQACGVFDPPGTPCDDGLYCNGNEVCSASYICLAGTPPGQDSNPCTDYSCDEQTQIIAQPNSAYAAPCPDSLLCNGIEICDGSGQCVPGASACADGDLCTGIEDCDELTQRCEGGTPIDPEDGNPCTTDLCTSPGVVTHNPVQAGTLCSDGNPCNGIETCDAAGHCQAAIVPPSTMCQTWTCPDGRELIVQYAATGTACNDGNSCTSGETCDGSGSCGGGTAVPVGDGNPCTLDQCDPAIGPVYPPVARNTACGAGLACDGAGRCLESPLPSIPIEPSPAAPDLSVVTPVGDSMTFLYLGSNPIQTGVTASVIDTKRVGVVRGRVLGRDAQSPAGAEKALPGVTVSLVGHSEFGQTLTRADGWYDMAVNGGDTVRLRFEMADYLPAERAVTAAWQDYTVLEDVVLVRRSDAAHTLTLCPTQTSCPPASKYLAPVVVDPTARRSMLFFPAGLRAKAWWSSGLVTEFNETAALTLRVTEYTEGPRGPQSMPAELPTFSAYTYATEVGASLTNRVEFETPIVFYVDNFLDINVGQKVPVGALGATQQTAGAWTAEPSGRVIKIVSDSGGLATVDCLGNGQCDLTLSTDERQALAAAFNTNDELWRVSMTHLTPWDLNWPRRAPDCSSGGPCEDDDDGGPPDEDPEPKPCKKKGSIIECEPQVLGQVLPVAGTPFAFTYRSGRTPGATQIEFTLPKRNHAGASVRLGYYAEVSIAGRRISATYPASDEGSLRTLEWDGLDAYGRRWNGSGRATLTVDELFPIAYAEGETFGEFSLNYLAAGTTPARMPMVQRRQWKRMLDVYSAGGQGLGGWNINVHHTYDPWNHVLYLGDGSKRTQVDPSGDILASFAYGKEILHMAVGPDGAVYATYEGTYPEPDGVWKLKKGSPPEIIYQGGPYAFSPAYIAVGPDGKVYVSDAQSKVGRIDPGGVITTVAGTSQIGFSGDEGPATQAHLCQPLGLAVANDSTLYIADYCNFRIRKVTPDGIIHTIAGIGSSTLNDCASMMAASDQPAQTSPVGAVRTIALGTDQTIYFTNSNGPIYQIDSAGIRRRVAGTCHTAWYADNGDGGPALDAKLRALDLAMSRTGSIYFTDTIYRKVRRVDPNGIVRTIVGRDQQSGGTCADLGLGDLASRARLTNTYAMGLALAPDSTLYVGSTPCQTVMQLIPALSGAEDAGQITITSDDGRQNFVFDMTGRHLATTDSRTGASLYEFSYTSYGGSSLLTKITEPNAGIQGGVANETTIDRDAAGVPLAIVAPFKQRTELTLDANGYLDTVKNPLSEVTNLDHDPNGLLVKMKTPGGGEHVFEYDEQGGLIKDSDSSGGTQLLSRQAGDGDAQQGEPEDERSYTATHTTPLGRQTKYTVESKPKGGLLRTIAHPDGTRTTIDTSSGDTVITSPDGTVTTRSKAPHPEYGMLSALTSATETKLPSGLTRSESRSSSELAAPSSGWRESITVGAATLTVDSHDDAPRRVVVTSPEQRVMTTFLDDAGRATRITRPGLADVQLTYDVRGRLETTVQGTRTNRFYYYSSSQPALPRDGYTSIVRNPLSQDTTLVPDALGRVREKTFGGATAKAFFDSDGNVSTVETPGQKQHDFTHSPNGVLTAYDPPNILPGSDSTTYVSDLDRKLLKEFRQDALVIDRQHDTRGRIDVVGAGSDSLDFSYFDDSPCLPSAGCAPGRLKQVVGPSGVTVAYEWDGGLMRKQTWSGSATGSVEVVYNAAFRVQNEKVNGEASTATFGYDNDGLPSSVGVAGHTLSLFYDQPQASKNGLLRRVEVSGIQSVAEDLTYNSNGELATQVATVGGLEKFRVEYETVGIPRDDLGRVVKKYEVVDGQANTWRYSYDGRGRLEKAWKNVDSSQPPTHHYTYDLSSNRTSVDGGLSTATFDDHDRLNGYQGTSYTYTTNGELRSATKNGVTTLYTYDAFGNLRKVEKPGQATVEYVADAQGRRVGKKIGGTLVKQWLYKDQLHPIAELDGAGNVVGRFVYASRLHAPDLVIRNGTVHRILVDELGSVRMVVNVATGSVVQKIEYDPWGLVVSDTNPGFQPFGFAGGMYDVETALVRFGARDYMPLTGRWTAKDPILFGGGLNLYAYVFSDPVNAIDPSGLTVYLCSRIAELTGNQARDIANGYLHYWLWDSGSGYEAGMGPAPGGWGGLHGLFQSTSLNDHRGNHNEVSWKNVRCEAQESVNEACVDSYIDPSLYGESLGPWFPLFNDCGSFAYSVLKACSPQGADWLVQSVYGF